MVYGPLKLVLHRSSAQNLMKLGHNKRAKFDVPDSEKPPVRKIKEWVVGMSFFSVGNILNFVSFGK